MDGSVMGKIVNLFVIDRKTELLKHVTTSSKWHISNDYLSPALSKFELVDKSIAKLGAYNYDIKYDEYLKAGYETDFCNNVPYNTTGKSYNDNNVNLTTIKQTSNGVLLTSTGNDCRIQLNGNTKQAVNFDPATYRWAAVKYRVTKGNPINYQLFIINNSISSSGYSPDYSATSQNYINDGQWHICWCDLWANNNIKTGGAISSLRFDWLSNLQSASVEIAWIGVYNVLGGEASTGTLLGVLGDTSKYGSLDPSDYNWKNINIPSDYSPAVLTDPDPKSIKQGDWVLAKLDSSAVNIEDKVSMAGMSDNIANLSKEAWKSTNDSFTFNTANKTNLSRSNLLSSMDNGDYFYPVSPTANSISVSAGQVYVTKVRFRTDAYVNVNAGSSYPIIGYAMDRGYSTASSVLHKAYAWNSNGTDRFTTSYPLLNMVKGSRTAVSVVGNNSVNQGNLLYAFDSGSTLANQNFGVGDNLTVEFDWVATNPVSGTFFLQWQGVPWGFDMPSIKISSSNGSGHVKYTFAARTTDNNGIATGIGYRLDNVPTNTTVTFSKLTVRNTSASQPWMPAPSEALSTDYPTYGGYYYDNSSTDSMNPSSYIWGSTATNSYLGFNGSLGSDTITPIGDDLYEIVNTRVMGTSHTVMGPYQVQLQNVVDNSAGGTYLSLDAISVEVANSLAEYSSAIFFGSVDSFSDNTMNCKPWIETTNIDILMRAYTGTNLGSDIATLLSRWVYGQSGSLHLPSNHIEYKNAPIPWSFVPDASYGGQAGLDAKINLQSLLISLFKSKGFVYDFVGFSSVGNGKYKFATNLVQKNSMINMVSWSLQDVINFKAYERPSNISSPNCVLIARADPTGTGLVQYSTEKWYITMDNSITNKLTSAVFQPTINTVYKLDNSQYNSGTAPTNAQIADSTLSANTYPNEISFSYRMDRNNSWTRFVDMGQKIRIWDDAAKKYWDSIISGYELDSEYEFIDVSCGGIRTSLQSALDKAK